jgi:hypothetical protein
MRLLKLLDAGQNYITDISVLNGCIALEEVRLQQNNVLAAAGFNNPQLKILNLADNPALTNIDLSGLPVLETLYINQTQVHDLSSLQGLQNLKTALLNNCQITDITPLAHCSSLCYITLQSNQVTDFTPFLSVYASGGLRTTSINGYSRSPYIDIQYNNADLTPGSDNLPAIEALTANGVTIEWRTGNQTADQSSAAWQLLFKGTDDDRVSAITSTSDGSILLTGTTFSFNDRQEALIIKIDAAGAIIWQKTFYTGSRCTLHDVIETLNGDYLLSGTTTPTGTSSGRTGWLLKINSAGNIIWNKAVQYPGYDVDIDNVQETSDNGLLITGTYYTTNAYEDCYPFVMKCTDAGNTIWQTTLLPSLYHAAKALAVELPNGEIITVTGARDNNAWTDYCRLIKLDGNGIVLESKSYTLAPTFDLMLSAVKISGNQIFVIANCFGIDYGGFGDGMIFAFDFDGEFQWQRIWFGNMDDWFSDAVPTTEGGILVSGYFSHIDDTGSDFIVSRGVRLVNLMADGSVLWQKIYEIPLSFYSIYTALHPEYGYILAGCYPDPGGYNHMDLYLARLLPDGTLPPLGIDLVAEEYYLAMTPFNIPTTQADCTLSTAEIPCTITVVSFQTIGL